MKVKVAQLCLTLCDCMDCIIHGILQARILGIQFLLHGIFPTQGLNQGLLHCRRILYQLSYQGSLSEISQIQKETLHDLTYVWNLKQTELRTGG